MTNKTILITGASSGMGLSHAIYLTSRGFNVIATYLPSEQIDLELLQKKFLADNSKYKYVDKAKTTVKVKKSLLSKDLQKNLPNYISKIKFFPLDSTSDESVTNLVAQLGEIDVLINNAGIGYFGPIEDLDLQKAKNQFEVNFFGYLRLIKAFIPQMRERMSGQIINISSLAGVLFIPFQSHYSASKAAILRMTEGLQMELKPFNIKVSAVLPSDINTSFNSSMVYVHDQDNLTNSTDILEMKKANPVQPDSHYYGRSEKIWKTIIENLIVSPPPIVVSKKVEKIINSKKPKVHYKAGMKFQTIGLSIMKRFFTEDLTVKIMASLYE